MGEGIRRLNLTKLVGSPLVMSENGKKINHYSILLFLNKQGNNKKKELNFFKVIANREQASGLRRPVILCILGLAIFL